MTAEQVVAEIHLDEGRTMEDLRRHAAGQPVPGQLQDPEPRELPNLRRDGATQRVGGHPEAPERRAAGYPRRDSPGQPVPGKVQDFQTFREGRRQAAVEGVAGQIEHLEVPQAPDFSRNLAADPGGGEGERSEVGEAADRRRQLPGGGAAAAAGPVRRRERHDAAGPRVAGDTRPGAVVGA